MNNDKHKDNIIKINNICNDLNELIFKLDKKNIELQTTLLTLENNTNINKIIAPAGISNNRNSKSVLIWKNSLRH
tara:strand:- start:508 stop:732 length:225 start_codon:yes stop_codon:yes gene_type:complete